MGKGAGSPGSRRRVRAAPQSGPRGWLRSWLPPSPAVSTPAGFSELQGSILWVGRPLATRAAVRNPCRPMCHARGAGVSRRCAVPLWVLRGSALHPPPRTRHPIHISHNFTDDTQGLGGGAPNWRVVPPRPLSWAHTISPAAQPYRLQREARSTTPGRGGRTKKGKTDQSGHQQFGQVGANERPRHL